MAKIDRVPLNVQAFGSQAIGTERTVFGDVTQSDLLVDNLNNDFYRGWGIVGPNDLPTKQDFNAMGWTLGQLMAYVYQFGVPQWVAQQEYHEHSIVNVGGILFRSLQDNNTNKDPLTQTAWWTISEVKNNYTATTNPTVANDNTQGYMPGSKWYNTATSEAYMNFGNATGAAVWIKTTLTADELGALAFLNTVGTAQLAAGAVDISKIATTAIQEIRRAPQNLQNANYSFALTDQGGFVMKNNTTAYAWTIDPESTTNLPVGSIITLVNAGSAGNITLTRGAGVTLIFAGVGNQNVTITPYGMGSMLKVGSNYWVVSGAGLS